MCVCFTAQQARTQMEASAAEAQSLQIRLDAANRQLQNMQVCLLQTSHAVHSFVCIELGRGDGHLDDHTLGRLSSLPRSVSPP